MKCKYKGCAKDVPSRDGSRPGPQRQFCSQFCKSKHFVTKARIALKQRAVDHLGGKCMDCGYSKKIQALQFHHRDPSKKDFTISADGRVRGWEKVKEEIEKCDLLCANCHIERHYSEVG